MNWAKNRVRVWRTIDGENYRSKTEVLANLRKHVAEIKRTSTTDCPYDVMIFRSGSKNCPVKLNCAQFYKDGGNKASNSLWRNLLFTVNDEDRSHA